MGVVLVFDMDQTIIDSSDDSLFRIPDTPDNFRTLKFKLKSQSRVNINIVNILKRAARLRLSGKVSAICLLTNNSDAFFVSAVDGLLKDEISYRDPEGAVGRYRNSEYLKKDPESIKMRDNQGYFFDVIMMRHHSSRKRLDSPPKSFEDVKTMMGYLDKAVNLRDVYFFDDIFHKLDGELIFEGFDSQSIKITPPFDRFKHDFTNYEPVLSKLSELEGPKSSASVRPPATPAPVAFIPAPAPAPRALTVKRTVLPPTFEEVERPHGRKRANAFNNKDPSVNSNNSPPHPVIPPTQKPRTSLFNTFPQIKRPRNGPSGGRRKSRRKSILKENRNKTRNRFRK
jgi:hypothetical protein